MMFRRRPPIRPLRLLGITMLMITAIITLIPEHPSAFPGSVTTQLVALGTALGLYP